MLLYILLGLAVSVVIILIAAAMKANTARYERSVVINASPEMIQPHVADLHKWTTWSPYEKLDPAMERSYGGAASGKGATYSWEGNRKAGAGSMVITDASVNELKIDLNFLKPFRNDCRVVFTFMPQGASTNVTWTMDGPQPIVARIIGIFMNFDKLVGGQFAEGLANLKAVVEK